MKSSSSTAEDHNPSPSGAGLFALSITSVASLLGIWSVFALTSSTNLSFFPPPWEIGRAVYRLTVYGFAGSTIQSHLLVSFWRFLGGYSLAIALGIPLGLAMSWSPTIRAVIAPFFETFRFIAPLAWLPFAAIWFGTGIGGPVFIVFSGAFAACVINTFRGATMVDPIFIEAAKMLCASPWRLAMDVLVPGSLPAILAGMRISAALAWQALVGAELIAAQSGLGYLIVQGQGSLQTSIVLAGMLVIGAVGFAIDFALQALSKRVHPARG